MTSYGGSALRAWETTHFDPSIIDVLDSSPEMLSKVRAAIKADKQAQQTARKFAQAEADENFRAFQARKESERVQPPDPADWRKALILAAGGLAVSVTTAGVRKGVEWYNRKKAQ